MLRYILVFLSCISIVNSNAQIFTTQQNIGGVINNYASVSSLNLNTYSFTVNNSSIFSECNKVLIIQMKGATIDETESSSFGDINAIGNAGNYEIRSVKSISGNVITFTDLTNDYDVSGKVQLIPVPEYQQGAIITSTLTCSPWDGSTGGVLIFEATSLTMDGAIDVTGMGFRAGANNSDNIDKCSISEFTDSRNTMLYRSPSTDKTGAEKGEGVAESSFMFSIGKLGSGGGGGGLHNGSGGGGSNYGQGGTGALGSVNCPSTNPQGAKGQGASSLAPYINSGKLFLGGGGGAGQGNNGGSSSSYPNASNDLNYGGAGGGIIIIKVDEISTTWTGNNYPRNGATISIIANGESAPNKIEAPQNTVYYDGAGGGGAGGSVLLDIGTINTTMANKLLEVEAYGGRGGDTQSNQDCYAPGGGGGGGLVYFSSAATPNGISAVTVSGGIKGDMHGGQENTASCQVNRENTNGSDGIINYNLNLQASACCPTLGELTIDQSSLSLCNNNSTDNLTTTFVALTSGTALSDYTITWYKDDVLISGQNGSSLSNAVLKSNGSGDYSVSIELNSSLGCTFESPVVGFSLLSVPTATISNGQPVCDGVNASLPITLEGVAPWSISYTDFENTQNTITNIATSPYSLSVADIGNYTLTEVSDDNCTNTASGQGTFSFISAVVATADMECNDVNPVLDNDEFQIRVTVTQGDQSSIVISELTSAGVSFTDQGGGVWLSSAINETNLIDINVTDVNDCSGGIDLTDLQQKCSCPATSSIALTGGVSVCPGSDSEMEITFGSTVGTGPFNVTVTRPTSGDTVINGVVSPLLIPIRDVGGYSATVEDVGNTCEVAATGSVSISHHTLPTATLTGDATICNETGVTTDLSIAFTGTSTFNVDLLKDGNPFSTEAGVTSPHPVAVSGNGVYTIANVSDANCSGTIAIGTATIEYFEEVVATASMECDDVNPALAFDEFQIRVTVSQGDLASIAISELTSFGVSFVDQGGGVWLSSAIDEDNEVDINVSDVNDCSGGIDLTELKQTCSCPATGTITLSGADPVCPGTESEMEIIFSTTIGTGPFNVTVTRPTSGDTVINGAASPLLIPIRDVGGYSATVEDVGNTCEVAATGSVSLANHTLPSATLTGDTTICNETGVTTPLSITFTGTSTFNIDLLKDGNPFSTETGVTSPHPVSVSGNGIYTIENVSDANCSGTITTGTATIGYHDDVIATASLECDDVNASLDNDEFQIRVTVTQGDQSSIVISELTTAGVSFTDQGGGVWLSSAISETNTIDLNVKDGNKCNGGTPLPDLNQKCSCPTRGTISLGTNPICVGASSTLEIGITTDAGFGNGPYNVTISKPDNTDELRNNASSPVQLTVDEKGVYTAKIEDETNNCTVVTTGSAELKINIPTAEAGDNTSICDGETLPLSATGTGNNLTYSWLSPNNSLNQTSSATPMASPSITETYTLTVTDDATCTATDNVTITVNASPSITNTVFEETICSGEVTNGFVFTADKPTIFNWTAERNLVEGSTTYGTGNVLPSIITGTSSTQSGTVVYTVIPNADGCDGASEEFTINVNYKPSVKADLEKEELLLKNESYVELNGSHTGTSSIWTSTTGFEDMINNINDPKFGLTTTETGMFDAILTAFNGTCSNSDTIIINIVPPLEVPNAFSPNGDGINDNWVIKGIEGYPDAQMTIFNRWGAKLYERFGGYPEESAWNGDSYPIGTYYYILKLNKTNKVEGEDDVLRGALTITK